MLEVLEVGKKKTLLEKRQKSIGVQMCVICCSLLIEHHVEGGLSTSKNNPALKNSDDKNNASSQKYSLSSRNKQLHCFALSHENLPHVCVSLRIKLFVRQNT